LQLAESLASEIVNALIDDLKDRRGLRQEWDRIDDDIREEIRERWQEIAAGMILFSKAQDAIAELQQIGLDTSSVVMSLTHILKDEDSGS
jgi:hypothetical protein